MVSNRKPSLISRWTLVCVVVSSYLIELCLMLNFADPTPGLIFGLSAFILTVLLVLLKMLSASNFIKSKYPVPSESSSSEVWRSSSPDLKMLTYMIERLYQCEANIAYLRHMRYWQFEAKNDADLLGQIGLRLERMLLYNGSNEGSLLAEEQSLKTDIGRIYSGDVRKEMLDSEDEIKRLRIDQNAAETRAAKDAIEKKLIDLNRQLQDLKDWREHCERRKPALDPVQEKFEKEYVPELTRQEQARVRAKKSRVEAEFEKIRNKNDLLKRADSEPDLTPADRERLKALIRKEYEEEGGVGIYKD